MTVASLLALLNKVGDKFPQVWPMIVQEVSTLNEIIQKLQGTGKVFSVDMNVKTAEGSQCVSLLKGKGVDEFQAKQLVATLEQAHEHIHA